MTIRFSGQNVKKIMKRVKIATYISLNPHFTSTTASNFRSNRWIITVVSKKTDAKWSSSQRPKNVEQVLNAGHSSTNCGTVPQLFGGT